MARIDWNDSFTVNSDKLDTQHQKLIELYNDLHESHLYGSIENAAATRKETLNKLVEYIDYHFKSEEQILEEIHFPDLDAHRQTHKKFTNQVKSYQKNIEDGELVFTTSLIKLLRNWITDHILTVDKMYSVYLNK